MLTIWHKIIAISQIICGALGLVATIMFIVTPQIESPAGMYLYSPIIFGATLAAGVLLLKRNLLGYRISLTVQTAQIIQISTLSFTYNVAVGLQTLLVFGGSWFRLSPGFNVAAWIGKSLPNAPSFVAVNAFSLVALFYLLSTRWRLFPSQCNEAKRSNLEDTPDPKAVR